jgi:uncharacterized protein (DUF302 family)
MKMTLLKISSNLGVDRVTLKEIAKANNLEYTKKDGMKFYNIFDIQRLVENTMVTIYKPVYINTTYHIYESKMNYDDTI